MKAEITIVFLAVAGILGLGANLAQQFLLLSSKVIIRFRQLERAETGR